MRAAAAALVCTAACSKERGGRTTDSASAIAPRPAPPAIAAGPDSVPGDSAAAVGVLDSLRAIGPTGGVGFDTTFVPPIRAASVLAFVSDSGLTFDDVNQADSTIHVTRAEIDSQLTARRGRAYLSLVHLAHIYSQPYPQYSQLELARVPAGLEVSVGADMYRVTFAREGGRLRLRRVSYLEFEGH